MREERGREIDFPSACLDFDDAPDDEVADLGGVARAEGGYGEEFVGAGEGAGEGGDDLVGGGVDGGGGGGVGAVPAHPLRVCGYGLAGRDYGFVGMPGALGRAREVFGVGGGGGAELGGWRRGSSGLGCGYCERHWRGELAMWMIKALSNQFGSSKCLNGANRI